MEQNLNTKITVLVDNTTTHEYGLFTDKVVVIQKEGQIVLLEPSDLRQLEKTLGCSFTQ